MRQARPRLAVDFGTSTTIAMLRWPDGRVRPLLFDGSPILPSAVLADPDDVLVGADAQYAARSRPERFEPNPKLHVDEGRVLLGPREVPVVELIAAVLRRVLTEAVRTAGEPPAEVLLTHPAAWGPARRAVLRAAATRAGIGSPVLVAEPVAAARAFAVHAAALPPGGIAVVYDLGAGTFDVSVVRREWDGYGVLATDGLPDTGGLDVDAAIVAHLRAAHPDPGSWARLTTPSTADDRRAHRQLWDDVKRAKEMLSRVASTQIVLPLIGVEVPLGREELDALAAPLIARTVATVGATLRAAGAGAPDAVYLVGGGSRFPLVATALHRALGLAPTTVEQPELVVAEGALLLTPAADAPPPGTHEPGAPDHGAGVGGAPEHGARDRGAPDHGAPDHGARGGRPDGGSGSPRRSRRALVGTVTGAIVLVAALVVAVANGTGRFDDDPSTRTTPAAACNRVIAVLGAETGQSAGVTAQIRDAARLAADQRTRARPACPVRLEVLDTQGDPLTAAALARTLTDRAEVVGVVGPLFDGEVAEAGRVLDEAGLPFLTPMATSDALSRQGWRTFHRMVPGERAEARAIAAHLRDTGARSVLLVSDGRPASTSEITTIRTELRGSLTVIDAPILEQDPAAVVTAARNATPDTVVFAGGYPVGGPLLRALREAGVTARFVGNAGSDNSGFITGAGAPYAQGAVVTCPCFPQESAPPDFRRSYRSAFAVEPGVLSPAGYDATRILIAGLDAGAGDRTAMRTFVDDYRGEGTFGRLRFQDDGELHPDAARIWFYQVDGGVFRSLGSRKPT
ncbi:ABC transporter substrate-binding protein [Cryptosporangium arvum]|uniref:Molecular chaperone n=1 Tax=Cryptosporangium arvum DSM 44712 TaxID=927661 RepID=A0A011AHR9_9ACTN|nr:ABC transporter substrate-binding protein [Cryptosporangium arvum]EXG81566.1 molecular chaperone [Cryptosporangium arvum DSM 44712]